jgi:hypothetical protein
MLAYAKTREHTIAHHRQGGIVVGSILWVLGREFRGGPHIPMEVEMNVKATRPQQVPATFVTRYDESGYPEDVERGYGWVLFAGTLLLMLGTLNFIEGIAAIGKAHFFVGNAHYTFWSLSIFALDILAIFGLVAYATGSPAAT